MVTFGDFRSKVSENVSPCYAFLMLGKIPENMYSFRDRSGMIATGMEKSTYKQILQNDINDLLIGLLGLY